MSWFSKRRSGAPDKPASAGAVPEAARAGANHIDDAALDTLASVLRNYGKFGFDTRMMVRADLDRRCDAWARHVSNGAPAPVGGALERDADGEEAPAEARPPVALSERAWPDLQQFFSTHRRDEQRAVNAAADGMRTLIGEMTRCLREAVSDDQSKDRQVATELSEMNIAVNTGSLPEIQSRFAQMMHTVGDILHERKERQDAQLSELADAVHELRNDLMVARTEARTDPLTELNNRGAFDEVFAKQVDYAFLSGTPFALVLFDLDHFKSINDTYGHQFGDEVLQSAAKALLRSLPRSSDFIARYGGEEFAVLLTDFSPDRLESLVNRILDAIRVMPLEHNSEPVKVTASAGVATYNHEESGEQLLQRADEALYEAKDRGRNRMVVHQSAAEREAA